MLVAGRPEEGGHIVSGVSFENVTINIQQWTNYTCPWHDFRPAPEPMLVPSFVDGIVLHNVDGVPITSSQVVFATPRKAIWGTCLQMENAANVDYSTLVCENPGSTGAM